MVSIYSFSNTPIFEIYLIFILIFWTQYSVFSKPKHKILAWFYPAVYFESLCWFYLFHYPTEDCFKIFFFPWKSTFCFHKLKCSASYCASNIQGSWYFSYNSSAEYWHVQRCLVFFLWRLVVIFCRSFLTLEELASDEMWRLWACIPIDDFCKCRL